MKTAVSFVAQEGRIEFKARLLAGTLRVFAPSQLQIIACVPKDTALSRYGHAVFKQLDVEIVEFEPVLWKRFEYPIGNKLDCSLAAARRYPGKRTVFIDSDVMAVRSIDFDDIGDFDLAAAPIFRPQVYTPESTPLLNGFINGSNEMRRLGATPYPEPLDAADDVYNSGLVMLRSAEIVEKWTRLTELVLESSLPRKFRKPFADQTSLALMKRLSTISHNRLPRFWNAHPQRTDEKTMLVHYHAFGNAMKDKLCVEALALTAERLGSTVEHLFGELSPKDILSFRSRA